MYYRKIIFWLNNKKYRESMNYALVLFIEKALRFHIEPFHRIVVK